MKKMILVGSIFAVIVIILASFSSVANARAIDRNDLIQTIRDKIDKLSWIPGEFLVSIIVIVFIIISIIINHGRIPPP